ncbi:hypothetical protein L798_15761 [Zootermopsis nevadensis]|uniref:Zasp-like motif domain-containing protein n=1 Tax=Zootermopsis nevadensis TaxID=136037 RepID=A0A067QMF2_ZOONE|nr:hypothetical protein L798_15761 [Zootermopsis nevadensis]
MSLGRGAAPTLVNKQFNSPIRLYSPESVQEALNKHTQALSNGAIGIDFHQLAAPNLANSAVLKMLEEEERQRGGKGLKRVAWPPPSENSENIVAEQAVYKKVISARVQLEAGKQCYSITLVATTKLNVGTARRLQSRLYTCSKGKESDLCTFSLEKKHLDSSDKCLQGPVSQQQNTWENSFDQVPASQLQQQQEQNQFYPPPQQQVYQPQYETPPTTVVLRAAAPVSQEPPPVFTSQPAATKGVGQNMRGDQKWPPSAYKLQAEAENEARKALAKGPAFRPKKVKKDYSAFFAQNALTPNYPTYKAPPGTQHYIEEGTSTF